MRMMLKAVLGALALVVIGFVGCRVAYPRYEWHQKITVEVETPQGPLSASSVAEVAWWGVPKILPNVSPRGWSAKAEAVVLRMPNGQYLFALVGTADLIARAVLFDPLPKNGDPYLYPASQMEKFRGQKYQIPPKKYPLLVTFADVSNPATVKLVDPRNLDIIGVDYKLKQITLEITDEPVTREKVQGVLPWLSNYPEPSVLPELELNDFSAEAKLRYGDFLRQ
ncbi:MAG: hypothetical protein J0H53_25500 [Rhizobiales bacterium]|nr:hypothetical protein [Hyphomicrobiales bacterium]